MLFGISTKVLRDYTLEEAIEIIGKCGYGAVEIWIDDFLSSGLTPDRIIEITDFYNLQRTVHLRTDDLNICSFNEGIREESLKQIKEGIYITSQLNAIDATLHPGRKTSKSNTFEEAWDIQLKVIKELAECAKECGTVLCVEGMEKTGTDFVHTPEDLQRIVNECQNGALGVTIDISHLQTIGNAVSILKECRALPVQNVHVSQTTREALHLPLYTGGDIDYSAIFKELKTFYNKALIVEGYKKNLGKELAENTIKWYNKIMEEIL